MTLRLITIITAFFLCPVATWSKDVSGVAVPDAITVQGTPLQLNGAGVRSKFFVDIYVGGLYLPAESHSAREILETSQANRVVMHFLYDEVRKDQLIDGWIEGFENNQDAAAMKRLRARLDRFNALFETVHSGDVVELDYVPESGTVVRINGAEKGVIEGPDFNRALLAVWLGDKPADGDLKDALLGK